MDVGAKGGSMSFTFVGRKEEIQRFRESVEVLLEKRFPNIQVFLIGGEGGFGKTTLLRRYEEIIREEYSDSLLCIYLDCEQTGLRAQDGTLPLMRMLVDLLKEEYPEFLADRFEQAWHRRINGRDRHQHQVKCSKAFVEDLISLSSHKPLVILLDTWERVESFASDWLRQGLLRHSLEARRQGQGYFVFVIAGRFSEEFILNTRDALSEFSSLIHARTLSRFTRSETEEFLVTQGINVNVEEVYRLTKGIPLALSIFKEMAIRFQESGVEGLKPGSADVDKEIIQALVTRFFRHLENYPGLEASLYRKSFYTLAMVSTIRYRDYKNSVRIQLLQKWWEKTFLHGYDFSQWAERLQREFSFVQSGLTLHPDVQEVLVRYLKEGYGKQHHYDAVILAQKAIEICNSMLTSEIGGSDKIWNLYLLNFLLWAQEYEQGLRLALSLVSSASSKFRNDLFELLSEWEEDVAEHGFKQDISSLLNVIDKWGDQEALDCFQKLTIRYQPNHQDQDINIMGLLSQAQKAARRGNYVTAIQAIESVTIKVTSPSPFEEWALKIHSTVHNLLNIKDKQAWLSALRIVQEGRRIVDDDPWLLLAEARVLNQLKMFPQALVCLQSASLNRSLVSHTKQISFNKIWEELYQAIQRQVTKMPQGKRRGARILTNLGDLSGAYGDFGKAEQYYQKALEMDSYYIPAAIKRANLLRQMGRLDEAAQWLGEVEHRMETIKARDIVAPQLLTQWRAGLKECWGSLYATRGVMENHHDDLEKSISYFQKAIELSSNYANPYIGKAWVYLLLGKGEEAYSLLEKARRILEKEEKGPLYQVYNRMGIAAMHCGRRGEHFFTVALTLCEQTRKEKITRPYQVIANHGIASLGLKNFEQASEDFRQLKKFRKAKGWWAMLKEEVRLLYTLLPKKYQEQAGIALAIIL